MEAKDIINAVVNTVSAAGKVFESMIKGSTDRDKITGDNAGKIIDGVSTISKACVESAAKTITDSSLTKEYKASTRLDNIINAEIKCIAESDMSIDEKRACFKELKMEEDLRKETDENRASEESNKRLKESGSNTVKTVITVGGTALGGAVVYKIVSEIFKRLK